MEQGRVQKLYGKSNNTPQQHLSVYKLALCGDILAVSQSNTNCRNGKMSKKINPESNSDRPTAYHIKIEGHLGNQWSDWFDGLTITIQEDGNTLLSGSVIDDAALHGLLKKVRDLGMPLISVNRVVSDETDVARAE
jgi:hypothetical protein